MRNAAGCPRRGGVCRGREEAESVEKQDSDQWKKLDPEAVWSSVYPSLTWWPTIGAALLSQRISRFSFRCQECERETCGFFCFFLIKNIWRGVFMPPRVEIYWWYSSVCNPCRCEALLQKALFVCHMKAISNTRGTRITYLCVRWSFLSRPARQRALLLSRRYKQSDNLHVYCNRSEIITRRLNSSPCSMASCALFTERADGTTLRCTSCRARSTLHANWWVDYCICMGGVGKRSLLQPTVITLVPVYYCF